MASKRLSRVLTPFSPRHAPCASVHEIDSICRALSRGRVLVLSGAGLSTESGLRDYRQPGRELRRKPMNASDFASCARARQRYWARSFAGFEMFANVAPNRAHHALSRLHREHPHTFPAHITQNVDGLLQAAGAAPRTLVELHGTLSYLRCGECGTEEARSAFQERLKRANPGLRGADVLPRPDGDAEVPEALVKHFRVPGCLECGSSRTAPGVVFHGGTVPAHVTQAARRAVDDSDVVWVIGSTLTTYSSYSLVLRAKKNGARVIAVNYGATRADHLYDLKSETQLGDTVQRVAAQILGSRAELNRSSCVSHR